MAGRARHEPFLAGEHPLARPAVCKTSLFLANRLCQGTNEASLMTILYKFPEQEQCSHFTLPGTRPTLGRFLRKALYT